MADLSVDCWQEQPGTRKSVSLFLGDVNCAFRTTRDDRHVHSEIVTLNS